MIPSTSPPDFLEQDLRVAPLERAETIPSRWYTDPRLHEFDREHLFARKWQLIGHCGRLTQPGDYLLGTAAGNPVILVRDHGNLLRAFFNVCRHRGGPLAIEESGNCNALQCKYHGWTYTLEGMLRGVPQFDRVELFDRKDFGLIPVEFDNWEGLLFVRASNKDHPSLSEVLKPIGQRVPPSLLNTKKFYRRVEYRVDCNWKVYVDNYLEGYHLPYVHPELCTILDLRQYVTETYEHVSLQYSPVAADSIYGLAQRPGLSNSGPAGDAGALYYFIFPNIMFNILPGRLQTNVVLPLAHNKTRVIFDYYYNDIASAEALRAAEQDITYSDKVQEEDREICEHVQKGLESIAYDRGRFSVEMERGVHHFQSLLKESYRTILGR
jgi:choline monooxygenase